MICQFLGVFQDYCHLYPSFLYLFVELLKTDVSLYNHILADVVLERSADLI